MVFSSQIFLFGFLPTVLLCSLIAERWLGRPAFIIVLIVASLIFYGWWNVSFLAILAFSIALNYAFGRMLARRPSRPVLAAGVAANLALLGYYKYAGFLADTLAAATGVSLTVGSIALPLAISFFTFQQVAYLADVNAGLVREHRFLDYVLFVVFFPQLISGPIVHHSEMMPQFATARRQRPVVDDLLVGAAIFSIGLYKKVVLADGMAVYADSVFDNALAEPTLLEAWAGALAYTFQIYFDFSGYSDMAIGLARLFGIRLPLNFDSPYKAVNIIDFWRRWHMTLSRFLRDYLYIPLGGSRRGPGRRHVNIMIVMLLGGLWHGAGWSFVVWGGLHGLYLMVNHGWHHLRRGETGQFGAAGRWGGRILTFLAVVVAWVCFRATDGQEAAAMMRGIVGLNGVVMPWLSEGDSGLLGRLMYAVGTQAGELRFISVDVFLWFVPLLLIVWFAPNTQQIMERFAPALGTSEGSLHPDPTSMAGTGAAASGLLYRHEMALWLVIVPLSIACAAIATLIVVARGSQASPFLYMFF